MIRGAASASNSRLPPGHPEGFIEAFGQLYSDFAEQISAHLEGRAPKPEALLVQAAAKQWQVDPSGCTASKSEVTHKETGRKLSYGELASAAGSETPARRRPIMVTVPVGFAASAALNGV